MTLTIMLVNISISNRRNCANFNGQICLLPAVFKLREKKLCGRHNYLKGPPPKTHNSLEILLPDIFFHYQTLSWLILLFFSSKFKFSLDKISIMVSLQLKYINNVMIQIILKPVFFDLLKH